MHSSHFRQGFSILICINKKGHFVSVIERAWKAMRVKRVCKSCIREHSDNCPKFDLRKYIASSLTAPNTADIFTLLL